MPVIYLHSDDCKCGVKSAELPLRKDHPWYVRSKAHGNCFWCYMRHNVRPHTLQEIADLLGLSISAITSIERKAHMKLRGKADQLKIKEKNS